MAQFVTAEAAREVKRRMKLAGRIRPRRQLSGPPDLELVSRAVEAGAIGQDHLRVISRDIERLPSCVSATDRGDVERSLVREAGKNDVEIVKAVAGSIDEIFNPDGDFDEADRARRRGLHLRSAGARRGVAVIGLDRPGNPLLCGGGHRGGAARSASARRHVGRDA